MDAARRRMKLEESGLYLVVDARPEIVEAALRGGVDVVQLRDKSLDDSAVVEAGSEVRRLCERAGALFILNDRPDLARECGADGVHLGQEDLPVSEARSIVGSATLVGLSTHSHAEIKAAAGVDYIAVGPVWPTLTKPERPGVGLELVAEAARIATVPFFAIGGIDEANAGEVVDAGARRIAVIRAIADAVDPESAARALRGRLYGNRRARSSENSTT